MSVSSDLTVEWDFDNDGDFSESVEDITSCVLQGESFSGRNWPSMLQGKSTPGTLNLVLDNSDDRYNFFNTSSPVNSGAFSLQSGRKIRVRTATSSPTDIERLAFDRFTGTGAIGSTENGLTWTTPTGGWTRTDNTLDRGELTTTAAVSHAIFDPAETTGYLQTQLGPLDVGNLQGLIYRWTDSSNLGLVYYDSSTSQIKHATNVAGTFTVTDSWSREPIDGAFLGVDIRANVARPHWNGVLLGVTTAYTGAGDEWGLYAEWPGAANQRAPFFYEMYMYNRPWLFATVSGVIWTGKVVSILPDVDNSGRKIARLKAEGPLAELAAITILPKVSTGSTVYAGTRAGEMVGNIYGHAGHLHPPALVSRGSFELGPHGFSETKAITHARRIEESEQGFILEERYGALSFLAAADRGGAAAAVFSDDPTETLNYESFKLLDWRREIINKVESAVSSLLPDFVSGQSWVKDVALGVQGFLDVTMPAAAAGDLSLVIAMSSVHTVGETWITPPGWVDLRPGLTDERGLMRIFAKVLTTDDLSKVVRFYNDTALAGGSITATALRFADWRGDISDGVAVAFNGLGEFPTQVAARLGTNDPPLLYVPWGREPSHFLVVRGGARGDSAPTVAAAADNVTPNAYGNMSSVYTNAVAGTAYDTALQLASRVGGAGVEDPSTFLGTFTGFNHVECATIAIRGAAPVARTTHDRDSQLDHGEIRSHVNASKLFPSNTEADDYNDEILARYADDSPIIRIGFTATKDSSHRDQAAARSLNDVLAIEADNNTGMGIASTEYVIESIRHRWSKGTTMWWCEFELAVE